MRPNRLELEGFTSFRDPTVVDFDGADVFAFTGPTGAGKSSLVDAMGFALYGRIHRYGEKLVHAAISQGRNEARVRLDFSAGGADYTAVRVVRRTGPGRATTKEARLERGDEVLAGDEKGLTTTVTELLGLDFEQYCRCVVLPQGAFADFLHDTPKGRQDLLASLLDFDHYRQLGQLAGQRAAVAKNRADLLEERLVGDLAGASAAALAAAEAAVARIEELQQKVAGVVPQLDSLRADAEAAVAQERLARKDALLLGTVRMPGDLAGLAEALATARAAAAASAVAAEAAERAVAVAAEARAAAGDRRAADLAVDGHGRKRALAQRRQMEATRVEDARRALAEAGAVRERVDGARAEADAALEEARAANRAHALVGDLRVGEACPVCQQTVHQLPAVTEPADYAAAQQAVKTALALAEAASEQVERARHEQVTAEAAVAAVDRQLAELTDVLAPYPELQLAEAAIAAVEAAEAALEQARRADAAARKEARAADERVRAVGDIEQQGRRAFEAARDAVGRLEPPSPERVDLAEDWRQLVAWAEARREEVAASAAEASVRAERATAEHGRLLEEVVGWCGDIGVVVGGGRSPAQALEVAGATAAAERRRVGDAVAEAERVRTEVAELRAQEQVAHTLAVHLRVDRFEKWLLDEAMAELTDGATGLLRELSGGGYSLILDDKSRDFAVIDHRNADEVRPVRTLSGGETFLASLALALALSDRVAELAAAGAVKLEALFLDEGFGTLDADTLDVVSSAIENLGASGRMVGLVTHVRELAERVPVRFEVQKGPSTSTVEKVLT